MLGGNARFKAYPRCSMVAKYVCQIANVCSPRIMIHCYYKALSLAWLCCPVPNSSSRGEEGFCSLYTLSSHQLGGTRARCEQYFCSLFPALSSPSSPAFSSGLLLPLSKVLKQSKADVNVVLVPMARFLLRWRLLNHDKYAPYGKPNFYMEIWSKWGAGGQRRESLLAAISKLQISHAKKKIINQRHGDTSLEFIIMKYQESAAVIKLGECSLICGEQFWCLPLKCSVSDQ